MDTIAIRGKTYKVEPFSSVYFKGLIACFGNVEDVTSFHKTARTIKEIVVPTLPDTIIYAVEQKDESLLYLWHHSVEPDEVHAIVLQLVRCFRLQKIAEARAKGDERAVREHFNGLKVVYKRMPELELQDMISVRAPISEPIIDREMETLRKNLDDL